jgi:hypothetical protein
MTVPARSSTVETMRYARHSNCLSKCEPVSPDLCDLHPREIQLTCR